MVMKNALVSEGRLTFMRIMFTIYCMPLIIPHININEPLSSKPTNRLVRTA